MSSNSATAGYVKIQIGADLRRISLKRDTDLPTFKAYVWTLFEARPEHATLTGLTIKYRDADGDLVTLGSTEEFQLFVTEEVLQKKDVQQRLFVSFDQPQEQAQQQQASASSAPAPQATPPPPPLHPAQVIANALSDVEAVRSLQNAVASPVINDALVQVAQGFASGGPLGAWAAVAQAVPTARAVLDEAMDNNPVLCDARKKLAEAGIDVMDVGSCMNFAGRGFGGGFCQQQRGPRPHHHHRAHHARAFHPWVVCDGCSQHPELKAQSLAEGFHNPRGWIAGTRHKSLKVSDYDLCESCLLSGRFDATHGPFEAIQRIERRPWDTSSGHCARSAAASSSGGCGPRGPTPPCHPHGGPHHGGPHHGGPHHGFPHHFGPHHGGPHHHPHHPCQPEQTQQQEHNPWVLGGMPFFEWARHHQNNQQPQHQARGCRGSRRDVFSSIFRDVVAEGASAVERAAKENDNDELAALARAFTESFRSSSTGQQAAAAAPPAQQQAKEDTPDAPAPQAPAPVEEVPKEASHHEDEEWEVPDVSPSESEDPFVKWQAALQQLALLGFTESENYVEFLEEEKGDLERVVNRIVRRAA